MWQSFNEVLKTLSTNEQIGLFINIIGIIIGFVTAQYSVVAGAIIFSGFFVALIIVAIYALYARDFYGGIYEVLNHENIWELDDVHGSQVTHTKNMQVKFIQNNVIAIEDFIWGDGVFMKDYSCTPGHVADTYKSGSRTNVLISIRDVKNKGDIENFEFKRKIVDGFKSSSEWVEIMPIYRTRKLNIKVVFPIGRPCKRATLTTNANGAAKPIQRSEIESQPDGRQAINLVFENPKIREVFTIRWDW